MKPSHTVQVPNVPGLVMAAYPMNVIFAFALIYAGRTFWVIPGDA